MFYIHSYIHDGTYIHNGTYMHASGLFYALDSVLGNRKHISGPGQGLD